MNSWNPTFHNHVHKPVPWILNSFMLDPVQIFIPHYTKLHVNIVHIYACLS
jgi:hypothetical protein